VERWDVAFAGFYLDALEADTAGARPARPWEIAFSAPREMPALRHVLLGMNAHINFDLPQALVAVLTDDEFGDAVLLDRRSADHRAVDRVLVSRVAAEDDALVSISGRSLRDRLLQPLNRLGTHRFLRESREKVWANAMALSRARRQGPDTYTAVLAEPEELSAAKVATLKAPGQVLLRLAATGFGVRLRGGRMSQRPGCKEGLAERRPVDGTCLREEQAPADCTGRKRGRTGEGSCVTPARIIAR
jgi:uncharacterized protein DUF5995